MSPHPLSRRTWRITLSAIAMCSLLPTLVLAQSPWETAATKLKDAFTGEMASALSLVAIAVGGFVVMFGDGASKRLLAGLIAGISMAVGAVKWFNWLFK